MDFELDDAQQAIAQVAGEVLSGPPELAWKELGRSGMLSLAVPQWLGGEGLGMAQISVLLAEVGRRAAAVPALATLALGVLPVARWGSREQQEELLAPGAVLTAALREPSAPMPYRPRTVATEDLRLTGTKMGVPYAAAAYRILIPVCLSTGDAAVALLDPAAPGVGLQPSPTSGDQPEYTLVLSGAAADGLLGGAGAVPDLYRHAIAGGCAVGDGVLAGALGLTAKHVAERHQFGRPLATFQAVAQQIADVYIAARTVHLAATSACWGLADPDLGVAAYWLASQLPPALRTCHHLHGGQGMDVSCPLHRYSALGKDLVRFLGGPQHCLDRLGGTACSST
ncbi:MAG: 3-oxo-4-pregnene-20-carboxyl-CoA dehydrogenase alpha subunit [Micromonosporaceae bacterium]